MSPTIRLDYTNGYGELLGYEKHSRRLGFKSQFPSEDYPSSAAYVQNCHLSKSDRIARRKFCRIVVSLALGFCLHRVVVI